MVLLAGCSLSPTPEETGAAETIAETTEDTGTTIAEFITFESVSQPYLDQYGEPEEVDKYNSEDYHTVDWWYWTQGFEVSFIDSPYDDTYGWRVDSTYEFEPIY